MSVGSCTSCSPILDAASLSANPKADLNKDGKVTTTELQAANLQKDLKVSDIDVKDVSKTNTDSKTDPYIASKNQSNLSGATLFALAEAR